MTWFSPTLPPLTHCWIMHTQDLNPDFTSPPPSKIEPPLCVYRNQALTAQISDSDTITPRAVLLWNCFQSISWIFLFKLSYRQSKEKKLEQAMCLNFPIWLTEDPIHYRALPRGYSFSSQNFCPNQSGSLDMKSDGTWPSKLKESGPIG